MPRNSIMLQIVSEAADVIITTSVSGVGYNPDIYDDVRRRASEAYREALTLRYAVELQERARTEEQEAGE